MKPYWPRTRQLFPAHLQASDAYAEGLLHLMTERLGVFTPGVIEMLTDDAAWQQGVVGFRSLSVLFPSGLLFASREGIALDGHSLPVGVTPIFLAVPRTVLRGPNVVGTGGPSDAVRYDVAGTPGEPWLAARARIVTEPEPTDDVESVCLGSVERSGTRLQWQDGSIPTAACVSASTTLRVGLERLVSALIDRKHELLRFRADHPFRMSTVPAEEMPALQLLVLIQRYLPLLSDHAARVHATPRELYGLLAELYGAIAPFAAADLAIPPYVHERLSGCFPLLFREIAKIVDEAARDRTAVLPFQRQDGSTFRLTFERQTLVGKRPFLVASGAEEAFLRDRVPSLLKMASPSAMPPLLQSALRGVAVAVEFEPASSIPRRPDIVTYRIDIRDPLWLDIEDRRSVMLYLPNAPASIQFALYGVERTV